MTVAIVAAGLSLPFAASLWAQQAEKDEEVQRIIAVVNDEVISEYDVGERTKLIESTTGQTRTAEEYDQLRTNVIELLVDEKLQLQEARELEANVTEPQVQERFAELAQRNGVSVAQFDEQLSRMGASKDAILRQMQASMAWEEVVNARLRPFLAIGEGEVNGFLERLVANKGEPEYRVGEIFLSFNSPDHEVETRQTADRLVRQIRDGADFESVAQQFSDVATGAVGGDMGWIIEELLEKDIRDVLINMREGDVSEPIRTPAGYYIVSLRDQRKVMSADNDEAQVDLQQIVVRIGGADEDAVKARVSTQTDAIQRCSDIPAIASAVGAWDYGSIGTSRLGDLQPALKHAVEPLSVGQASKPIKIGDDVRVLVVCGKTEPDVREPSFEEIEDFLSNQKLSMMARRYLRDLRRDAIIDYR
ncbi:MAG: peptidylprolyl isomerase [Proteobacteria bacterium]|nr:peptidylprolyl isomerase [Pseudomonadota bacterium]